MKISAATVHSFCKKPTPSVRAVLVYGANEGLVRERAQTLVAAIADSPSDPFRISEVSSSALARDQGLFFEEVEARSLTGQRRVLIINDADDRLTKGLVRVLSETKSDTFLVLCADNLESRSSLRKAFEAQSYLAAIACYADEGASLEAVITQHLSTLNMRPSPETVAWLVEYLGCDRGITRQELDKLALYVEADGRTTIEVEDARLCIGDSSVLAAEDLAVRLADGHVDASQYLLTRLAQDGMSGVALLRIVARYFQRLHLVSGALRRGYDVSGALGLLKPQVFWKIRDAFVRQAQAWSVGRLGHALDILLTAEIACKTTTLPEQIVVSRAFLRLASGASPSKPRRSAGRDIRQPLREETARESLL